MHVSAFMCISQGRLGEASQVVKPSQGCQDVSQPSDCKVSSKRTGIGFVYNPLKTKPNQLSFPGDTARGSSGPLG